MKMINLFSCQLFSSGTEFTVDDLSKRAVDTMDELKKLIPELNNSYFEILYKYVIEDESLSLVVAACLSSQMSLDIDCSVHSLPKFRLSIVGKIKELPLLLNSIVLAELSDELFDGIKVSGQQFQSVAIKKLIKKKQGKRILFCFGDGDQLILFPTSLEYKLDPEIRTINCKVDSIKKYHADINCVQDAYEEKAIPKSKIIKLNLINFMADDNLYTHFSNAIHYSLQLTVEVQAVLDGITGSVREYVLRRSCLNNSIQAVSS